MYESDQPRAWPHVCLLPGDEKLCISGTDILLINVKDGCETRAGNGGLLPVGGGIAGLHSGSH